MEYTQGGQPGFSNSSFGRSVGIDSSALTRYRETLPAATISYLEQNCLPELFWQPGESTTAVDAAVPVTPYSP